MANNTIFTAEYAETVFLKSFNYDYVPPIVHNQIIKYYNSGYSYKELSQIIAFLGNQVKIDFQEKYGLGLIPTYREQSKQFYENERIRLQKLEEFNNPIIKKDYRIEKIEHKPQYVKCIDLVELGKIVKEMASKEEALINTSINIDIDKDNSEPNEFFDPFVLGENNNNG